MSQIHYKDHLPQFFLGDWEIHQFLGWLKDVFEKTGVTKCVEEFTTRTRDVCCHMFVGVAKIIQVFDEDFYTNQVEAAFPTQAQT